MGKFFDRDLNLVVLIFSMLIISILVKGLSFLPDRYYFTFSTIVDAKNNTQFLAGPALPSPEAYCRIISVESVTEDGELRKPDIENAEQVMNACEALQQTSDLRYLDILSDAAINGRGLVSAELQQANYAIVDFLKSNQSQVFEAMQQAGIAVRKPIAPLEKAEIEKILFTDSSYGVSNAIQYIADDPDLSPWAALSNLREATQLGDLIDAREEVFAREVDELRATSDWLSLAGQYRDLLIANELELLKKTIVNNDNLSFWPAILLKIMPALAGAFIIGLFWRERVLFDAPIAAGLVAFLFCWPIIMLWDAVVADEWKQYRNSFFSLYIAYILSYYFAARLGAMLALKLPYLKLPQLVASTVDWGKIATTAVATIVTSAITAFITWSFAS